MMRFTIFILGFIFISLPTKSHAVQPLQCGNFIELHSSIRAGQSVAVAISQSDLLSGIWGCSKNFFMGVWEGTGGAVVGAWDCVTGPIDCAHSAVKGVKNAWNFVTNFTSEMSKMYEGLSGLSQKEKTEIVCEMIGGIGGSVAMGILTAGAGALIVVKTISMLSAKILKIAKVLRSITGVAPKKLARLADDILERAEEMVDLGYQRFVRSAVEACPL